ncbi:hypothetical protein EVAR_20817_1 [Eumeta japonica]|uniref:Uncharacterized protein n=1 Tax=Eumeta variegata TaxID=151549 RepID=A0A4C1UDD9_EUMVA|nr:hypothetical protein EVAR_20817_1 [Eumeta japonica]
MNVAFSKKHISRTAASLRFHVGGRLQRKCEIPRKHSAVAARGGLRVNIVTRPAAAQSNMRSRMNPTEIFFSEIRHCRWDDFNKDYLLQIKETFTTETPAEKGAANSKRVATTWKSDRSPEVRDESPAGARAGRPPAPGVNGPTSRTDTNFTLRARSKCILFYPRKIVRPLSSLCAFTYRRILLHDTNGCRQRAATSFFVRQSLGHVYFVGSAVWRLFGSRAVCSRTNTHPPSGSGPPILPYLPTRFFMRA